MSAIQICSIISSTLFRTEHAATAGFVNIVGVKSTPWLLSETLLVAQASMTGGTTEATKSLSVVVATHLSRLTLTTGT